MRLVQVNVPVPTTIELTFGEVLEDDKSTAPQVNVKPSKLIVVFAVAFAGNVIEPSVPGEFVFRLSVAPIPNTILSPARGAPLVPLPPDQLVPGVSVQPSVAPAAKVAVAAFTVFVNKKQKQSAQHSAISLVMFLFAHSEMV